MTVFPGEVMNAGRLISTNRIRIVVKEKDFLFFMNQVMDVQIIYMDIQAEADIILLI